MPMDLNCASGSSVKVNDLILYIKTRLKGDKGDEGARGLQGLQGVRGFTGVRGLQGNQGVAGHDGKQGVDGHKGDEGASIHVMGTETLANILAVASPVEGQIWVTSTSGVDESPTPKPVTDGDGLIYRSGKWIDIGRFRGIQGIEGHKGDTGDRGTSIHFEAAYDTLADLIAHRPSPEIGETHLVRFEPDGITVKGDLYVYDNPTPPHDPAGAAWHDVGHVQGPAGPRGVDGHKGDKGDKGDHGADGAQGVDGHKGDAGANGHKGDEGDSIHVMGTETLGHIFAQTTANEGDIWITTSIGAGVDMAVPPNAVHIGDGLIYRGGKWITFGQFRGIQGDKGDKGDNAIAHFATHNEVVQATHATAAINTVEFNYPKQLMYKGIVPATSDWNTFTKTGIYDIHGGTGSHSPVVGPYGQIMITEAGAGYVTQEFTHTANNTKYRRVYNATNGWLGWVEVADQPWVNGNFLPLTGGTLSNPNTLPLLTLKNIAGEGAIIRGYDKNGGTNGWYVGRPYGNIETLYLKSYAGDILYSGIEHRFVKGPITADENITTIKTVKGLELTATNWVNCDALSSGFKWSARGGQITMTDTSWIRFNKSTMCAGNIATTGNVIAYYSDMRLKTKVMDIPNALDKVCSLTGFLYKRNELANSLGYKGGGLEVGVSAQDIKKVLPECVSLAPFDYGETDEDGVTHSKSGEDYMTVDYAKITPLLIEAIKELKAEIEELKKGK